MLLFPTGWGGAERLERPRFVSAPLLSRERARPRARINLKRLQNGYIRASRRAGLLSAWAGRRRGGPVYVRSPWRVSYSSVGLRARALCGGVTLWATAMRVCLYRSEGVISRSIENRQISCLLRKAASFMI